MTASPTTAGPARRWRVRAWDAIAVAGVVLLLTGFDLRGRFHTHVRLTENRWLSAPSTLILIAAVIVAAALVGRRRQFLGQLGLAAAAVGTAAAWLLLGHHKWAGPVLADFGDDHGLHLGDFLALVPLGLAATLTAAAWRSWRAEPLERRSGR